MITEIEVSHYKSISHLKLNLNDTVICIGKNATGKSNFLDAISFIGDLANNGIDNALTQRHGFKSVCQWSKYKPYDLTIHLKFNSRRGSGSYKVSIVSKREGYQIKSESGTWINTLIDPETNEPRQHTSSFTRDSEGKVKVRGVSFFDRRRSEGIEMALTDTFLHTLNTRSIFGRLYSLWLEIASIKLYKIYPNTVRRPELPNASSMLESDGSNICRIFKALGKDQKRNRSRKQKVISALRHAMPDLDTVSTRNTGEYVVPMFRIYDDKDFQKSHLFNASQISDGSLRLFALLVALYQPEGPSVIGLEEPEQNINPALVTVLCDAIKDVAGERQVFVSTHSPQLIDEFDLKDMIAFEFDDGVTKVGKIETEQIEIVKKGLMTLGEISVNDQIRLANAD